MVERGVCSVIIAEDEVIIRKDIAAVLTRLGLRIIADVPNGIEAIEAAKREHPDLLVLDIRLAGEVDGIETALEIQKVCDPSVLFITAYGEGAGARVEQVRNVLGFLGKPVTTATLRSKLRDSKIIP